MYPVKQLAFSYEGSIWYHFHHPIESIGGYFRQIKWFFKRGLYGFADGDTWDLDSYISSWMPTALRQLAKNTHSYPCSFIGKDSNKDFKKWQKTLDKMATGFEINDKCDDLIMSGIPTKEYIKKSKIMYKKEKECLELFIKYYHDLWD